MTEDAPPPVDDLLLLAGSNPLPLHLTAIATGARSVHLLATPATEQPINRLAEVLRDGRDVVVLPPVSPVDPVALRQLLAGLHASTPSLYVDYTGGTKLVAAVACEGVPPARRLRLDPLRGVVADDGRRWPLPSGGAAPLRTILALHGVGVDGGRQPIPSEAAVTAARRRVDAWTHRDGSWLEDLVAAAMAALPAVDEVLVGAVVPQEGQPPAHAPEVDVLATIRGQLVLVSCSVSGARALDKAYEARHRAVQLGGDRAQAAVVCLAAPATLTRLSERLDGWAWRDRHRVRFFGRDVVDEMLTSVSAGRPTTSLVTWLEPHRRSVPPAGSSGGTGTDPTAVRHADGTRLLVATLGSNPLPVAIAARQLAPTGLGLLATPESVGAVERLRGLLSPDLAVTVLTRALASRDVARIEDELDQAVAAIPQGADLLLSGGTKPMSTTTARWWSQRDLGDAWHVHEAPDEAWLVELRTGRRDRVDTKFTAQEVAALHGFDLRPAPTVADALGGRLGVLLDAVEEHLRADGQVGPSVVRGARLVPDDLARPEPVEVPLLATRGHRLLVVVAVTGHDGRGATKRRLMAAASRAALLGGRWTRVLALVDAETGWALDDDVGTWWDGPAPLTIIAPPASPTLDVVLTTWSGSRSP